MTAPGSGPTDQASVIRSEEVLDVALRTVVSGRVRLRKRIVTETVTQTVEVRREELVVEHEPVTSSAPADHAPLEVGGPHAFLDSDYEMVLHEERVVVTTRVVPIERVRLHKRVVTTQVAVSEQLRRDQVEVVVVPSPPAAD